jgi:ribonuclease HII
MDLSDEPLARLRERASQPLADAERRALMEGLRADPRRGARALAQQMDRRHCAEIAERERLARLFERRNRLVAQGARFVAGVDEVGMGPLAGPVVAVAVILPDEVDLPGLNDSKKLTPRAREALAARIREQAVACVAGKVAPDEIDRTNIYRAGLEAMRRAVASLDPVPDHVLVDARTIPGI